jgi:Sec-independent protein secretion pathway component TatC
MSALVSLGVELRTKVIYLGTSLLGVFIAFLHEIEVWTYLVVYPLVTGTGVLCTFTPFEHLKASLSLSGYLTLGVLVVWVTYMGTTFLLPSLYRREAKGLVGILWGHLLVQGMCGLCVGMTGPFLVHTLIPFTSGHLPQLEAYVSFVWVVYGGIHFSLGLCWAVCILLVTTPGVGTTLGNNRRWVHLGALCLSALLSPPELSLQLLCTLSLCLCLETVFLVTTLATTYTHLPRYRGFEMGGLQDGGKD